MWEYDNKKIKDISQVPEGTIGFIYSIINISNGKMYIGKKNLYHWKRIGITQYNLMKEQGLEVAKHKNKKKSKKGFPVWVYKGKMESDWLKYTGSNAELQEDIKNGAIIEKHIWEFANCNKLLTFLEVEAQFKMDVIRDSKKFYNGNILGKFFPGDLKC